MQYSSEIPPRTRTLAPPESSNEVFPLKVPPNLNISFALIGIKTNKDKASTNKLLANNIFFNITNRYCRRPSE